MPADGHGASAFKVLIADDSRVVRRVLSALVRTILPAARIEEAVDGPGAYLALRRCPDIAFIDTHMPGMSGPEAVARDRDEGGRSLVVLMADELADGWDELGRAVDAYDYLKKPIEEAEMRAILGNLGRMRTPTRVLVVDDSRGFLKLAPRVFAQSRFALDVELADSGGFALAMQRREPREVVFLDYAMPGVDGLEVACVMMEQAPATRIVMISASGNPAVARAARYFGAACFLKKPFQPNDVDRALHLAHKLPLTSLMGGPDPAFGAPMAL